MWKRQSIFASVLLVFTGISIAKQISDSVKLYAEPALNARVIETVIPSQCIVTIFRQNGWVKVGDLQDGAVGWLDDAEYRKVLRTWY